MRSSISKANEYVVGNILYQYNGKEKKLVIPEGITHIADAAFSMNLDIEEIIMPSSLISIGRNCFDSCMQLKKVVLNSGLKTIGDFSFCNCGVLKEIYVPGSVEIIGDGAFCECKKLENVIFEKQSEDKCGNTRTSIGGYVFMQCESLYKVQFERTFEYYERGIFRDCKLLSNIDLPEGMTEIPRDTFWGCTNLANVKAPNTIKSIEARAFYECKALKRMNFPQNNHKEYKENVECINLPLSLENIEHMAFADSGIEVVVFPEVFKMTRDSLDGCDYVVATYKRNGDHLTKISNVDFLYREDFRKYLEMKGFKEDEAYDISEFVRKGKANAGFFKPEWELIKSKLRSGNIGEPIIQFCEETKYLPSNVNSYADCNGVTNKAIHITSILKEFEFSKECIDKVKDVLKKYDMRHNNDYFVGGDVFNLIMDEFYNNNITVVDKFYIMSILTQAIGLTDEDKEAFDRDLKDIRRALREEILLRHTDSFMTEYGVSFSQMKDALEYVKTIPCLEYYIIDKINCINGKGICRYWFNKELEMIGYDFID